MLRRQPQSPDAVTLLYWPEAPSVPKAASETKQQKAVMAVSTATMHHQRNPSSGSTGRRSWTCCAARRRSTATCSFPWLDGLVLQPAYAVQGSGRTGAVLDQTDYEVDALTLGQRVRARVRPAAHDRHDHQRAGREATQWTRSRSSPCI